MADSSDTLLTSLAQTLNALPGVFSTPQWGGRAYKLPHSTQGKKKPKLLAHVVPAKDEKAVHIAFKLDKERAADMVDKHDWVMPHSFATLSRSGWVTVRISTKRQLSSVTKLLKESRGLYPDTPAQESRSTTTTKRASGQSDALRRMQNVMREATEQGWEPDAADDFSAEAVNGQHQSKTRKKKRRTRAGR